MHDDNEAKDKSHNDDDACDDQTGFTVLVINKQGS